MSRRRRFVLGVAAVAMLAIAAVPLARALYEPTTPTEAMDGPRFVEVAAEAGVEHVYDGGWPYFVGGGVAAFDCDDDGRPDLYLAGGSDAAELYRNDSDVGGELRFSRLPDPATDLTQVLGVYPLDVDGDGQTDLAVLRNGENVLLRGLGDCQFERANEWWGLDGGDALTTAFSATWEADATLPTLAFGNYVADSGDGDRSECHDNVLVRPDERTGHYAAPEALSPGWCALSMLFSDWRRTGERDLRISNDRHYSRDGEEQLWALSGGEAPRPYTRDDGWQRLRIWGMGIASHDVTGDGFPEVFLTSQGDNKLQRLADGPQRPAYEDIAIRRGATAHRPFAGPDVDLPSTAWHAEFQDANNDGFIDLFVTKGNVEAQPDHAAQDPNNLLLGQPDGTFVEGAGEAGVASTDRARGGSLVDLNLDGLLDLVVVRREAAVEVFRNLGSGEPDRAGRLGGWIAVRVSQSERNRDAIGAWVETRIGERTVRREITVGGGHASGQLGWLHLGIGPADRADVRVIWPDGDVGRWMTLEGGGFWLIDRDASEPRAWASPGD